MKEFFFQNKKIKLILSEKVFSPFLSSIFLAQNFRVKKNETVFDVGCGTGFFSILASKLGAKSVKGSDTNKAAVNLSKENAKLNNVQNSDFFIGNFFGKNNKEKYDVIVSNLPQVPITKNMKKQRKWRIEGYAGPYGNAKLCRLLELSRKHIKKNGRIYVIVAFCSNPKKTFELIKKYYKYKKLAQVDLPLALKGLSMPYLFKLEKKNKCEIYRKKNKEWYYRLDAYELRLK